MAEKETKELPVTHFDRRVNERYIKRGLLDEKEFARYLKALPDLADQASKVETEFTTVGELGPAR